MWQWFQFPNLPGPYDGGPGLESGELAMEYRVCVRMCVCVCVCVCVCLKEGESICVRERKEKGERVCVCVCVCLKEGESICVRERREKGERLCVFVSVCVRVCVCTYSTCVCPTH